VDTLVTIKQRKRKDIFHVDAVVSKILSPN
jgi:hypothetical protein